MTLVYYRYKAISKGQSFYFHVRAPAGILGFTDEMHFKMNKRTFVPHKIKEFLDDPDAIIEECSWEEWDKIPRDKKHNI